MILQTVLATLMAGSSAISGPVHLECNLPAKDGPRIWQFSLDESLGRVTIAYPDPPGLTPMKLTKVVPGKFFADEVRFDRFTVSRVTLEVRNLGTGNTAVCNTVDVSKRAF